MRSSTGRYIHQTEFEARDVNGRQIGYRWHVFGVRGVASARRVTAVAFAAPDLAERAMEPAAAFNAEAVVERGARIRDRGLERFPTLYLLFFNRVEVDADARGTGVCGDFCG